ncbi:MAG: hypothetical protein KIG50_06015, partial [Lachnospiraceae bacterium]|nr:hypothetical protein [Lachnospiraceae bacterium]
YKDYGATFSKKEDLIIGDIVSVVSGYKIEEEKADTDAMRKNILKRIQNLYGSEFIYNVVFREIFFQ